jgi:hypothetical protein
MTMRRLGALGLAVLVAGCGEFAPVNQYDPNYRIALSIAGPDTVSTFGDTIQLSIVSDPVWTGEPPAWTANPNGGLRWLGNGRFVSTTSTYKPIAVTIVANVGPHSVQRALVLRAVAVSLRYCNLAPPNHTDTVFAKLGTAGPVCLSSVLDSGGTRITLPSNLPIAVVSRDTSIAKAEWWGPEPEAAGQTWFVATFQSLVDSALIIVN